MNTTYLEESLQRDIDRIRDNIIHMSNCAEKALRDCVKSFIGNDRKLAYAVILRDQYIDEKEKEIDRLCLEFIIRQQPVALPMRFAYSTIKINLEIERIGDYAESIARHILKAGDISSGELKNAIVELAELSIGMFHDAIQTFFQKNTELAQKTIELQQTADSMRTQLNALMISHFKEAKLTFDVLDPLMTIIRRFERVADQARNICLEVLYMVTGEYAKHRGADAFRVLFVDDHNSCRSQMAESIAERLQLKKFIFSSAGLDPQAIDRTTLEFMKGKGVDLSRTVSRAILEVPNLEYYQVIVALCPNVYHAFPARSRKIIFLDWHVDDPSQLKGEPEKILEAYQQTYAFIESQVNDLVDAITDVSLEGNKA